MPHSSGSWLVVDQEGKRKNDKENYKILGNEMRRNVIPDTLFCGSARVEGLELQGCAVEDR